MAETKKKRGKKPSQTSTSSMKKGRSQTFSGLAELGLKIAQDIGADTEHNTTGKWIAQFLAEKLTAAEQDPTKRDECVELILKLWKSRKHWPVGDPFEKYSKLIDQFERDSPLVIRHANRRASEAVEASGWFDLAARLIDTSDRARYELVKQGAKDLDIAGDKLLDLAEREISDSQTRLLIMLREATGVGSPDVPTAIEDVKVVIAAIERKLRTSD